MRLRHSIYNTNTGISVFTVIPVASIIKGNFKRKWSIAGEVDSGVQESIPGLLGISVGASIGFEGRFSIGLDTTKIANEIVQIWWSE